MSKQEAVKQAKREPAESEMKNVKLKPLTMAAKTKAIEPPAKPVVAHESKNVPATVAGDGFDDGDESSARIIRGVILSCTDGQWSAKDGTEFSPDHQFIAMATAQAIQRWENEQVIEVIRKIPGQSLPSVDVLNSEVPQSEWEDGINGPRAPYQHVHIVYLLDPTDASIFTVINATVGMRMCYERLSERVKWMRSLRGDRIFPVVRLDKKPMTTRFGTKLRPELTVVAWRDLGGSDGGGEPIGKPPATPAIGKPVEPVTTEEALNDKLPF
jgi:hypothetical protein